jgi:hypothetical protein
LPDCSLLLDMEEYKLELVTIYQFEVYDPHIDGIKRSRRWGTREAVENIAHGNILESTAHTVSRSVVDSDILGMTTIDFDPHAHSSFLTSA